MAGKKRKEIIIQPYGYRVTVVSDYEDFKKEFEKKIGREYDGTEGAGLTTEFLTPEGIPEFIVYANRTGTLAHELMHVVMDVFKRIHSDPREGSSEPAAYLMGYLWEQTAGSKLFKV